jgi:lambda repressor-like predicted transcriptional regulator
MNINSVNANPANLGLDPSALQARFQQAFAPVAQLFGESTDQLVSDLKSSGTSLSALAQTKGVSQTDLVNAIKQGLQQSSSSGASALSDTQATNIANRIANHRHGGHHHHRSAGGVDPAGSGDGTGSGSALKLDVERLMTDLQSQSTDSTSPLPGSPTSSSDLLEQLSRFDQSL